MKLLRRVLSNYLRVNNILRWRRRCILRPFAGLNLERQFGYVNTRFRGLAKTTAQLVTLFAPSNLWMARLHLLANAGEVRP